MNSAARCSTLKILTAKRAASIFTLVTRQGLGESTSGAIAPMEPPLWHTSEKRFSEILGRRKKQKRPDLSIRPQRKTLLG
jgi:hypothetical protein